MSRFEIVRCYPRIQSYYRFEYINNLVVNRIHTVFVLSRLYPCKIASKFDFVIFDRDTTPPFKSDLVRDIFAILLWEPEIESVLYCCSRGLRFKPQNSYPIIFVFIFNAWFFFFFDQSFRLRDVAFLRLLRVFLVFPKRFQTIELIFVRSARTNIGRNV